MDKKLKMKIRPAKQEDINVLLKFEQELIKFERPFDPTLKKGVISYYDISKRIEDENSYVLLVESDNEIVGSGFADIVKSKPFLKHDYFISLGFFYVKENYRSKGVNKLILNGLIKWSKNRGLSEGRLSVYDKNINAKSAYLNYGFEPNLLEMKLKI